MKENHLKLVVLDRDGVINEDSADFIKSADEWKPLPLSIEAIALLNQHDYKVVIATNQSGLARGLFSMAELDEMHLKMHALLQQVGGKVEKIYFCPHGPDAHCLCRKPKPGLLHQIEADFGVSLNQVPMVGDSLRDLEAGMMVGCTPVLVKTGKGQKTLANGLPSDTLVFENLMEFAKYFTKT